ncbi:MAG TPA: lysophospholipid acyltransferase family protein [Casimicrobiaceae bacterium]
MIYALLRAIAGVALRWYYRAIQIEGAERIPRQRPLLLVVNHPNALVDALLVGWIVPRRVLITAKSTLFKNTVAARMLRWIGVVPLRRAQDVAASHVQRSGTLDPSRNRETFQAVIDALAKRGVVLIFPEGVSHDKPSLAPLKTGAARMALEAIDHDAARNLAIVPIGLVFERKDAPRTRVLVQVGEPILVSEWRSAAASASADALTAEIDTRLRAVTLNYATDDDAARAVRLASVIAALFDHVPPIGAVGRGLSVEAGIARRIEELAARLPAADAQVRARADLLARRLDATQHVAANHGILLEDVGIGLDIASATRFVLREGWLVALGAPFALWGRINHWLPFRAARALAMRSVESAADPAMRTLIAGTAFVLFAYLAQTAIVAALWGTSTAAMYLASLPIAAEVNFALSDRLKRARRRARAFRRFRRDPALQLRLAHELDLLREDVVAFDRALDDSVAATA